MSKRKTDKALANEVADELEYIVEPLDSKGMKGEIRVFRGNSGNFVASYKLGTVKWQLPVGGKTATEAMAAAKKWLTTSLGSR